MSDLPTTLRTAAQEAWRRLRLFAKKVHNGAVWLFAPVATSVRGTLNSTDFRPIITKIVVISSAAGVSLTKVAHEALKDPELAGAAVVLSVAVITGFLEALTRHQAGKPQVEILLPSDAKNQPPAPSQPPAPTADPAVISSPTGPAK